MKQSMKSDEKSGLTLIELMIALAIVFILWGSVASISLKTNAAIKEIIKKTHSPLILAGFHKIERDVYSPVIQLTTNAHEMFIKTFKQNITYKLQNNKLMRTLVKTDDIESPKHSEVVLDEVTDIQWKFLNKGEWQETGKSKSLPTAIAVTVIKNRESFQMIYRFRVNTDAK